MGKFASMCGKLEFEINKKEIVLTPKMGDNRKLLKIMNNKTLDEADKMDKVYDFIVELLKSSYPEEDQNELEQAVEFNLNDFMREILIGFNWTSKEKWDSLEKDASKKLMSEN